MFETVLSIIIILSLVTGLFVSLDVLSKWNSIDFKLLNVKAFLEENVLRHLWINMFIGLSVFFVGYLLSLGFNYLDFLTIESDLVVLIALVLQTVGVVALVKVLYDWSRLYKNAIEGDE